MEEEKDWKFLVSTFFLNQFDPHSISTLDMMCKSLMTFHRSGAKPVAPANNLLFSAENDFLL